MGQNLNVGYIYIYIYCRLAYAPFDVDINETRIHNY